MTRSESTDATMKRCTKCGETKPLDQFSYDKRHSDGRQSECKVCKKYHQRIYVETFPEKVQESQQRSRKANREKKLSAFRKWAKENKEKSRAACREWAKKNPEKIRAIRAKRRALKAKVTVGDLTAIQRVYDIATNGERVRCYLCGAMVPKGERHVDHIVPLSKGGLHTASNLAVACAACNLKKQAKLPEEIGVLI